MIVVIILKLLLLFLNVMEVLICLLFNSVRSFMILRIGFLINFIFFGLEWFIWNLVNNVC